MKKKTFERALAHSLRPSSSRRGKGDKEKGGDQARFEFISIKCEIFGRRTAFSRFSWSLKGSPCTVIKLRTLFGYLTSSAENGACELCFPAQHCCCPRLGIEPAILNSAGQRAIKRPTEYGVSSNNNTWKYTSVCTGVWGLFLCCPQNYSEPRGYYACNRWVVLFFLCFFLFAS